MRPRSVLVALACSVALLATACGSGTKESLQVKATNGHPARALQTPAGPGQNDPVTATGLSSAMRDLWSDHMQWTYVTVDAFFHDQAALQPSLDRLLQNQKDIGAAIVPYYGQAAGDKLAGLLTTHIQQAVPVLQAAKAGDKAALDKALADWHANAKEVADFLSAANPSNWPTSATEPMLTMHIDQTTTYSTDLLKGDYASAIKDFDQANDHMMELADTLTKGITAQFPDKVSATELPRTE